MRGGPAASLLSNTKDAESPRLPPRPQCRPPGKGETPGLAPGGRGRPRSEVVIRSDCRSDLDWGKQQASPLFSEVAPHSSAAFLGPPIERKPQQEAYPPGVQAPPGSEILSSGTRQTETASPPQLPPPARPRTDSSAASHFTSRATASQGPYVGRKP
ncbi:hypothetical protein NDU88_012154 [Pleurodeles waltl]|uniref:Uncharacterized protein n=1 Tax=Pleurodeles waltl TaxID=8319 RepID=A0AAV7R3F4_PLEWA|nr:hypothetical protein NDU88_012154 [Pleurodeles waltl]